MIDLPKTYPSWVFDDSPIDDPLGYGERAVNFIRHLKHPKSNRPDKGFVLDPWQERIVRRIYAPRHKDGSRIVKTVFAMIPCGFDFATYNRAGTHERWAGNLRRC